jgi:Na+-transporting NADH:ubiquinone oxidoreductase subunit NqrE
MDNRGQVGAILGWMIAIIFESIVVAIMETTNYSITLNLIIHIGIPAVFIGVDSAAFLSISGFK